LSKIPVDEKSKLVGLQLQLLLFKLDRPSLFNVLNLRLLGLQGKLSSALLKAMMPLLAGIGNTQVGKLEAAPQTRNTSNEALKGCPPSLGLGSCSDQRSVCDCCSVPCRDAALKEVLVECQLKFTLGLYQTS
jgi:hypothetical protein